MTHYNDYDRFLDSFFLIFWVFFLTHAHFILPNIFDIFQSGYRQNHSTETALLKITNSIFMSYCIPAWLIYSLMLLIMLIRLQNCLPSLVLLSNGFLHTCPCMSSSGPLMCGVPQSSILGPILFSLYIHPHQSNRPPIIAVHMINSYTFLSCPASSTACAAWVKASLPLLIGCIEISFIVIQVN